MEEEIEIHETPVLLVNDFAQEQLAYASRWARIVAIMGMVVCGILLLAGIVFWMMPSPDLSNLRYRGYRRPGFGTGMMGTIYILMAVVQFFPLLYLLQFAENIKTALLAQDQDKLSIAFQKLKMMFRYSGIVAIIVISIYVLIFLFAIIGLVIR